MDIVDTAGIPINTSHTGTRHPYFFCLGRHGHRNNGCRMPYLPVDLVEAEVEQFWSHIRVSGRELDAVRDDVRGLISLASSQDETELATQRDRVARLDAEEAKLLQAHYADAVSLPLLKKEQRRLMGERAKAEGLIASLTMEFAAMSRTVDQALARVRRCDEVYRTGSSRVRRELTFALFHRIYITEEGVVGSELAVPYAQLLAPDLHQQIEREREAILLGQLMDLTDSDRDIEVEGLCPQRRLLQPPTESRCWNQRNPASGRQGSNMTTLVGLIRRLSRRECPDQAAKILTSGSGEDVIAGSGRGHQVSQNHLAPTDVEDLVAARLAGAQIQDLALRFQVDRTTVLNHLRRAGVPHRRAQGRTLTVEQIRLAGQLYLSGLSLVAVGKQFDVDKRYLQRVLPPAGFALRRPGRQQQR